MLRAPHRELDGVLQRYSLRGHINFEPIFDALRKVGYDGYVTLEAIFERNLRREMTTARKRLERMI